MENALLIGLSRQVALSRELDVIANNVANIGTAGFKARALRFEEYIMPGASADTFNPADQPLSYVVDKGSGLDFSSGAVERTGRELDVAMRGNTILAVQTPQGERYTRNGSFEINDKGELVTSDGFKVLGDGGPILFNSTETGLSIAVDGTISSSEGVKGKLKLMDVTDPNNLENVGTNLFSATQPLGRAGREARIEVGAVEHSNVKAVMEMSRLIEVNRAYTSISTMITQYDALRRSAIEKLAQAA
jgi:flagellar basal-body rod protein FlgF